MIVFYHTKALITVKKYYLSRKNVMTKPLSLAVESQKIFDHWEDPITDVHKIRYNDIITRFTNLLNKNEQIPENFANFLHFGDMPLLLHIALDEDLYREKRHICYLAILAIKPYVTLEILSPLLYLCIRETLAEDGIPYSFLDIFQKIGPPAVDELLRNAAQYRHQDRIQEIFLHHAAALSMLHEQYRRADIFDALKDAITERSARPNADLTLLFFALLELQPTRADELAYLRQIYQPHHMDFSLLGDWEDLEIKLGLRETRSTPAPNYPALKRAFFHQQSPLPPHIHDLIPQYHQPRPKIGVNAPCPCGSGKKYKKCCMPK